MNLRPAILGICAILALLLSFFSSASSMDDPGFIINRMVICESVTDREPVGINETFSANTEKVYCFLEAINVEHDTTVSFVWYFEGKEMARMSLPLRKGGRWRTFSSKKLAGLNGNRKVELQESSGIVLNTASFLVQ